MFNSLCAMAQLNTMRLLQPGQYGLPTRKAPSCVLSFQLATDKFSPQMEGDNVLADEDESGANDSFEFLKTVTPVFNNGLDADIQTLMLRYEPETALSIPPAWRWHTKGAHLGWKTNKGERLKTVLWIMAHLPKAETSKEAINQMACTLERVETLAHQRALAQTFSANQSVDLKPMRLTQPMPETCDGQPLMVGYGIRHVTLFKTDGAVQVQCLPKSGEAVHYRRQAQQKRLVLLNKPGMTGQDFWQ